MKKILLSLAALGVIAVAAPASAQTWGGGYGGGYERSYGGHDIYRDGDRGGRMTIRAVDRLDWKITNAARQGRIDWHDARELRREVREVRPIAWRVQTGEARRWELARLERTVSRVERALDDRGGDERRGYDDDRYQGSRR